MGGGFFAPVGFVRVAVLVYHAAVDGDAGEEALRHRVAVYRGLRAAVGRGGGVASYGARRYRDVRAELEAVAAGERVEAVLVRNDEHEADGLHAYLEAYRSAVDAHEGRAAPRAVLVAQQHEPFARLPAEAEPRLRHLREYRDALAGLDDVRERVGVFLYRHFVDEVRREAYAPLVRRLFGERRAAGAEYEHGRREQQAKLSVYFHYDSSLDFHYCA